MGFFDDMQSTLNRGVDSANRTGRSAKLKMQRSDLMNQRRDLAAQLGASLYEATRNDPSIRAGREQLYDSIASVDAQCAAIDAELNQIAQQAAASAQAAAVYVCPNCGSSVRATQSFCMGCGTPIANIIGAAAPAQQPIASYCKNCGAPMAAGDVFCMNCGTRQDEAPAE